MQYVPSQKLGPYIPAKFGTVVRPHKVATLLVSRPHPDENRCKREVIISFKNKHTKAFLVASWKEGNFHVVIINRVETANLPITNQYNMYTGSF